jgi:hypothetical protein
MVQYSLQMVQTEETLGIWYQNEEPNGAVHPTISKG